MELQRMSPLETDFFTQDNNAREIHWSCVLFFNLWSSITLYGFALVCLPTHLMKDVYGVFSWAIMNKSAINIVIMFLYEHKFLFPHGK